MNKLRGHDIYHDGSQWRYCDTGEPTIDTWQSRPCGHCGLHNTPEGHDGCLGELLGVVNACCGHGEAGGAQLSVLPWVGGGAQLSVLPWVGGAWPMVEFRSARIHQLGELFRQFCAPIMTTDLDNGANFDKILAKNELEFYRSVI